MSFQLLLEDWQGSIIQDKGGNIIPPARNSERECSGEWFWASGPRSDCQPKSDFLHIWMESDLNTECPHSILQLFMSDLCVHKRFCFYWMCIGFYGNALSCYAYAKDNSNCNTVCNTDVLPLTCLTACAVVLYFVLWGSGSRGVPSGGKGVAPAPLKIYTWDLKM